MQHTNWVLAWQDWLFQLPWWGAMLALVGLTPVAIWLIRGLIQGLWVNPFTHDWAAANFDVVLGLAAGCAFAAIRSLPAEAGSTQAPMYAVLNYGGMAAGFGFAMFKWWEERHEVAGWRSRLGATSLYHVGVLTFMVPLYTTLIVDGFPIIWRGSLLDATLFLMLPLEIIAWVIIGSTTDAKHRTAPDGQSKFVYTSPADGWRNVRLLFAWLKTQYYPAELQSVQVTERFSDELTAMPLPNKIFSFPGWGWMLCPHPILIFVTGVILSPGIMELNDVLLVHGHFVPLNAQWLSALFDMALWGAIAIMAGLLKRMSYDSFPYWLVSLPAHLVFLFVPIAFGAWHVWDEWGDIPMSARLGINYLYHNIFLFPFLGYLLILLLVTTIRMLVRNPEAYKAWWYWLGTVVSLALIGSWLWAGDYDRTHQYAPGGVPKAAFANPADPWNGFIPWAFERLNDFVQWGLGPPVKGATIISEWVIKQFM